MSRKFKFYNTITPKEKSFVNFIFTEHGKDCFKCYLTDYDMEAIMPFQLATFKSSIKSYNSLAPLNKPMIGTVEEINDDNIILSMVFIDKNSSEYKDFENTNIKNKKLVSCIKQYAIKNKTDYIEIWEHYIYPIDNVRRQKTQDNSLFDFIIDNLEDQMLNFEKDLLDSLQKLNVKNTEIITKFKFVSLEGINMTKQLINQALEETNLKDSIKIMIESTPNYYIKSLNNSTKEDHNLFLKKLQLLGKNNIIISNVS